MPDEVAESSVHSHRVMATQLEALYWEIEKFAKKKPTEAITPFIAQKINHVIVLVREQVSDDPFLDAIETLSVESDRMNRFDEVLILLAELRGVLDRQWNDPAFTEAREAMRLYRHDQTMR